jgi:hypothetical protein
MECASHPWSLDSQRHVSIRSRERRFAHVSVAATTDWFFVCEGVVVNGYVGRARNLARDRVCVNSFGEFYQAFLTPLFEDRYLIVEVVKIVLSGCFLGRQETSFEVYESFLCFLTVAFISECVSVFKVRAE